MNDLRFPIDRRFQHIDDSTIAHRNLSGTLPDGQLWNTNGPVIDVAMPPYNARKTSLLEDASPAIQAAIDDIPESGGGTIYFRQGVYPIYTGLTALNKPNIRFVGEKRGHRPNFRNDFDAINRGVSLVGMTDDMTILRIGRIDGGGTGGTTTFAGVFSHQGPEVQHILFHDGTWSKPLISAINGWSVVSGTRYRITYLASLQLPGQLDFEVGDFVYFSDRFESQHSVTALGNKDFEILDVGTDGSNKYIEIDVGEALPAYSSQSAPISLENLVDKCTMTGLQIDSYTRYGVYRCAFALCLYGLKITDDAGNDLSWGKVEDNSFSDNKFGIWIDSSTQGSGGGSASSVFSGGDISVPSDGVGVAVGYDSGSGFTNIKVSEFKIDIGKDSNTTGDGAVGVDFRGGSNFIISDLRFENYGDATCIRVGAGPYPSAPHADEPPLKYGTSFGKIYGCSFQHNKSSDYEGTCIHLTGRSDTAAANLRANGVNVFGNSANQFDVLVKVDGSAHNNNIYGNSYLAGNYGVRLDSTTYLNNVFGNTHARADIPNIIHIDDQGAKNNCYMNPDAYGPSQDFIPTRDPLVIAPASTSKVSMALYPSRGYTPDLAQFRIEADDIEDSFTRADGSPGNTDTGEAWTVQTSVPSGADAGTWKIDSNELARDFQKFGSSSVTSTITVPAAADFTLLATLRTSTTDDRLQAGICFRLVDGSNFLYFEMQNIATSNIYRLRKMESGVASNLQTFSPGAAEIPTEPDTSYDIKIVAQLENIKVYLDDTKILDYDLTEAEQSTFLTPVNVGCMSVTGDSQDDGGTRWTSFEVQYTEPAFGLSVDGLPRWMLSDMVQTTVGSAGAASALPATPTKYLKVIDDDGTTLVIPAYAAS